MFRRIYYYCDQKDVFNSFSWGCLFQQEFDSIQEDFGLAAMDLMGVFDHGNLSAFRMRWQRNISLLLKRYEKLSTDSDS